MRSILHLFLILVLTIGVVVAPEYGSAKEPSMAMQMDDQDQTCAGCPSTDGAGIICDSGCTVPCGLGGSSAMIAPQISSTQFPKPFGLMRSSIDLLLPLGTAPALDPFPPKLPI
tara:strand:- start:151 stop:492 length:342 start_codon:yes stop_codon:yes gene_type:complete